MEYLETIPPEIYKPYCLNFLWKHLSTDAISTGTFSDFVQIIIFGPEGGNM
jgi:hypothetical protein